MSFFYHLDVCQEEEPTQIFTQDHWVSSEVTSVVLFPLVLKLNLTSLIVVLND